MVRALGAIMIGCSCGYFGFRMSASLKNRVKALSDISASLEMLESEIAFSVNKLKKSFLRIDRSGLFTCAAEKMDKDGIGKAWADAVSENKARLCLTDSDADILLTLGVNIGKTDTQDQIRNIRYVKTLINGQERQAENEYNRFGKLYRSGGILVGLMIIITII